MASEATAVIAVVRSRIEAEMIAGMLRTHGIRSAVFADDAGGWEPQLQQSTGVRVLVSTNDQVTARRLLREADKRAPE